MILWLQRGESVHEKRSFQLGKLPPKGGTTNFSFLALADQIHRPDGAAPLARRLAAGVGSRVALSRIVAGRVGATHMATQTRFTAAQPGRVLGCAVVTTQTMGGRDVSRFALWRADASEKSWLHRRGRVDARAGHWRERGALFGGQRRALESAALSAAGATRDAPPEQAEFRAGRDPLSEFY